MRALPLIDRPLLRRYLAVALGLALLLPLTWAAEQVVLRRGAPPPEEAAAEARAFAQARTTDLLREMEALARTLAADAGVRRVLTSDSAGREQAELLRLLGERAFPERTSVEVYTPGLNLVAWRGRSLPLDPVVRRAGFLDSLRTRTHEEGGGSRRALVLWVPVRDGEGLLGVVRVVRVVQEVVPVRNRYLEDYDLAETWRREVDLPLTVVFAGRRAVVPEAAPLRGLDGAVVGWVEVPPQPPTAWQGGVRERFAAVRAFWAVLLLGWALAGLGRLHTLTVARAVGTARSGAWRAAGALLGALLAAAVATRFALLALDVPARWAGTSGALGTLFDPAYLASAIAGGLLRSTGDLLLTAAFAAVAGALAVRFAHRFAVHVGDPDAAASEDATARAEGWTGVGFGALGMAAGAGGLVVLALVLRHAVLDATLRYFERGALVADGLVPVVLMALLALTGAVVLALAAGFLLLRAGFAALGLPRGRRALGLALAAALVVALTGALALDGAPAGRVLPWWASAYAAALGAVLAGWLRGGAHRWTWLVSFRGLLLSVLLVAPVTYALMQRTTLERRDALMADAARAFAGGQDARAVSALEEVLAEARAADARGPALLRALVAADTAADAAALSRDSLRATLDSLATGFVTGSLFASLADYSASFVLFSPSGDTLGRYVEPAGPGASDLSAPAAGRGDPLTFPALRARYAQSGEEGFLLVRSPVERRRGTYRYAGLGPLRPTPGAAPVAWVYAQARPRLLRYVAETPFPRVLVPADPFGQDAELFAYAEYDDGVLVRSRGDVTGPFEVETAVARALGRRPALWRDEDFADRAYRAYYERVPEPAGQPPQPAAAARGPDVIAVRAPAVAAFDHLFHLLRVVLAGFGVAVGVYLVGVPLRRRAGLLPAPRTRFRDRVLNRFLLVGILGVGVTGLIGQQVIAEQNRQAVRDLLRQRLQRAEATLIAEAPPGQPLEALVERARPEAIGAQLGIDLYLYRGPWLVASSRPPLVRQGFIARRLPASVYRTLFVEGQPYAYAEEHIGTFAYTTGYKAIPGPDGAPAAVVAVPTLPEQADIEAGQARIVAYLFGALLVLLVGIFLTTTLLASQLTRPFQRLRSGLQAVGEGQLDEPIPVEERDEVGELIEAFNRMQGQLAESRRRLAAQERELAWREMARQVAHEIRNPLTPMKLSVQHLRRAYRPPGEDGTAEERRFAGMLERISTTLIEQIDALDRIASEFSAFARLPRRHPERLDLSEVVGEAAALFEEEAEGLAEGTGGLARVRFELDLADGPLPVEADREELRRAFINLLKNAFQALPPEPVEPAPPEADPAAPRREARITARTARVGGEAVAEVEDTGAGIPDEVRPRIFQPNFSTKTSGMGLGLAIARKAVEAAGGTVGFETAEGAGTTFRVRLPLATEAPPGAPAGDGAAAPAAPAPRNEGDA